MIKSITILMIFVTMKKGDNSPSLLTYNKSLNLQKLQNSITQNKNFISVKGLYGSSKSFIISELFKNNNSNIFWVLDEKEDAGFYFNDCEKLIKNKQLFYFPSSYTRDNNFKKTSTQNIFKRTEFIKNFYSSKSLAITYPEALFEKIIVKKELFNRKTNLKTGQLINLETLNEKLFELNFERVDFVVEPGDFSVRGGIVDVFSFSNDNPYRIEFFGDEIESIRIFDIETQISINNINSIEILGDIENKEIDYERENIFKFLQNDTIIIFENIESLETRLSNCYKKLKSDNKKNIDEIFYSAKSFKNDLNEFKLIELDKINDRKS
jgi:transcription-repair coupling factor (superfamily II helicase)